MVTRVALLLSTLNPEMCKNTKIKTHTVGLNPVEILPPVTAYTQLSWFLSKLGWRGFSRHYFQRMETHCKLFKTLSRKKFLLFGLWLCWLQHSPHMLRHKVSNLFLMLLGYRLPSLPVGELLTCLLLVYYHSIAVVKSSSCFKASMKSKTPKLVLHYPVYGRSPHRCTSANCNSFSNFQCVTNKFHTSLC